MEKQLEYIIYSKSGCIFCDEAMELLKQKKYNFKEIKVPGNDDAIRFFKEKKFKTVPQIFDDRGNHIGGYQDLKETLEEWPDNPAEAKAF